MATTITNVRKILLEEEGTIDHMYLDTKGNVTVGTGYLVPSSSAALKLPWKVRKDNSTPTNLQVAKEYVKVASSTKGYKASYYKQFTELYILETSSNQLLDEKILEKQRQLRVHFEIDSFPELVQEVLIDMAFNFGVSKIVNGFPTFTKHIKNRDWKKASEECRSSDVSTKRNLGRKNKLLQAVKNEKPN